MLRKLFGKLIVDELYHYVGIEGEIIVDLDTDRMYLMDGVTPGGRQIGGNILPPFSTGYLYSDGYGNLSWQTPAGGGAVNSVAGRTGDVTLTVNDISGFSAFNQDLIPDQDVTRYLGSPSHQWHSIYVGPGSIYIGNVKISNSNGTLVSSQVVIDPNTGQTTTIVENAINTDRLLNSTGNVSVVLTASGNLQLPQFGGVVFGDGTRQTTASLSGSTGPTGAQGSAGSLGATGVQGPQGSQGPAGTVGPTGVQGPQGRQGEVGPQGPAGNVGPTGIQGVQGIQGVIGTTGAQGIEGPTGIQGPQGDIGAQGVAVTLKGTLPTVEDLPNSGQSAGDAWIVQATGNLFFWNSTASTWNDVGPIVGPAGPRGQQGVIGPQGPAGNVGPTGVQGPQGDQGNIGPTGAQGLIGPTGVQGPQGDQGNIGPTGAQGLIGPTGVQGEPGIPGGNANTGDIVFSGNQIASTNPNSVIDVYGLRGAQLRGVNTNDAESHFDLYSQVTANSDGTILLQITESIRDPYTDPARGSTQWLFQPGGSLLMPDYASLNSGGIGVRNSAELTTSVTRGYNTTFGVNVNSDNNNQFYGPLAGNSRINDIDIGWTVVGPGLVGTKTVIDRSTPGDGTVHVTVDGSDGSVFNYNESYTFTANTVSIVNSSINMLAGNAGISSLVYGAWDTTGAAGSGGPSLILAGVENVSGSNGPGFAGMVASDPGVNSQYTIAVDSNYNIIINATQGSAHTSDTYTAGLGVLNSDANLNGIFVDPYRTVLEGKQEIVMKTDRGAVVFGGQPEPGGPTHFHIMKHNAAAVDLFFGDDFNYVKLPADTTGVEVGANSNTWKFADTGNLTIPGNITSTAVGTPTISSLTDIDLAANNRVTISRSPLRFANMDTVTRNSIAAVQGDVIFNTDTHALQGFANGVWSDIAAKEQITQLVNQAFTVNLTNTGALELPAGGELVFPDGTVQTTAADSVPFENIDIDGGGAGTIYEINRMYADGGTASNRFGAADVVFDGSNAGKMYNNTDQLLNGGVA